jgi:acetylornithine deacetylase
MDSVIKTLASMVSVNSVNPAYGDGGSEANLAPLVEAFFSNHGIETFRQEVFPGRWNVIARLPGKTWRRVVLEAHMDTVSIKGMSIPPFEPTLRDGRLYGRGSVDDKAGLAAMMHAVASLKSDGITPPCEVWMAAVVDEEFSYRGVVKLCEDLQADAAVVAEPTELRAVIASKGVLRLRIVTEGLAAHSSKPMLGINAISHMSRLVLALEVMHQNLSVRQHPLLGPGTLNVGVINGGVQVNFVPDLCTIEVDRRLLPGEKAVDVLLDIQELIENLRVLHPSFNAHIEAPLLLVDEALETPVSAAVVTTATSVLRSMRLNDRPCGVPFGSDASKLSRAGIPAIVFGPGSIDQAHAADEYVEVAQVKQAMEFYRRFILDFGA